MKGLPKYQHGRHRILGGLGTAAVVMIALCVPAGAGAQGATLHVDRAAANCSNTGAGTAAQPFCSISAAAARTTAGTTVLVASGSYTEQVSVRSGTANARVTFRAAPGATPVVRGGTYAWYVSNKSYVTIEGFTVTDTASDGFHVSSGSHHIEVLDNHVYETGEPISGMTGKGIAVSNASDVRVEGNELTRISTYAIYLVSSTRTQVIGNRVSVSAKQFERSASGIRLYDSDANTVASNVSFDNEDSGIELVTNSTDNLIASNVAYRNGDHGIDLVTSPSNRVVGNSVRGNLTAGINVEGGSSGATLANNIAVDNALNSPRASGNIRVDSNSTLGTTLDYDVVHLSAPGENFNWNGFGYGTLGQFRAAVGQEVHGIEADPRWTAPATGDFTLADGSPAIDSANSAAVGQTATDAAGYPRVDIPAVPDTGAGLRTYDDRGAYEQQLRNGPPDAALAVTPETGLVDLAVTADASGSTDTDGVAGIAAYRFDFGDGSAAVGPQAGATANHTYTAAGTYTVTVTVTDSAGLSDAATAQVTVADDPPAPALSVTPSSGFAPLTVAADASASTDGDATGIASYRFDFGDGSPVVGPQAGATAGHTYTTGGTRTVTVTVTDTAGNAATATATVAVSVGSDAPPTAALDVTPSSGAIDLDVQADASGSVDIDGMSPIASYRFDFGDGSAIVGPQAGTTASHTYTAPGTYTVTVTVTDTAGLSDAETRQVNVRDDPPSARLSVDVEPGVAPVGVTADASASSDEDATPIESYRFDFGDGSAAVGPQAGATASHVYAAAGTYTVTVTVRDTAGLSATATATVLVRGNLVGNPGFESNLAGWNTSGSGAGVTLARSPLSHGGDHAALVTNTGTAAATCALNDSPDWVRSTLAGTYSGRLWARADAAGAVLKLRFREWVGPTLAGSAVSQVTLTTSWQEVATSYTTQSPGSTLDFNAYISGAAPGSCFYADDALVVHATPVDGPPSAALTVAPAAPSVGAAVQADASGSTDGDGQSPIESYRFDFGDGSAAVGPQAGATASHVYAAAGTYTVTVTVRDTAGLSATATATVLVRGNLVGNPGFESNLAGWNTSGSGAGVTLARSPLSHGGDHAALVTNTGTAAATCALNDSPDWVRSTLAGTYSGRLWARADAAGAVLKLRFREWVGPTLAGSAVSQVTLTTSWQEVATSYTTQSPGSTLDFNAYISGAAPGSCFYADDASIALE